MKKNLAIYIAIAAMTFMFAANSYGQAQDWINLIKGAIDKNKEKKNKEQEKGKTDNQTTSSETGQDEIEYNPYAPADYDAKLKVNDLAIGVARLSLIPIRIVSRNGGVIKAIRLEYPDSSPMSFKVNSVYPYFDKQKFKSVIESKERLISPLLECYAKKYNVNPEYIITSGYYFTQRDSVEEFKSLLAKNRSELKELEAKIKTLQSQPNTYLGLDDNPAFWLDVITHVDELERCAVAKQDVAEEAEDDKSTNDWFIDDIKEIQKEVESYTPENRVSLTYSLKQHDYVFIAVSPRERNKWMQEIKLDKRQQARVSAALDELAAAAAKKLPAYRADLADYKVRNPSEEKLIRGIYDDLTPYQIFSVGLIQKDWKIAYNDFGIPTTRYKHGAMYAKYKDDDHPYCYLFYVNIKQDYAGGGSYGASYAYFIKNILIGCPAGVK